ncbi:sigma-70 family RNA polymerase sigma factor [Nocardioides campestrisoli]|uniref:sigma-70 family RNA polymerase sigma factor n=1 Tax=Nocardioides campestrisoli TaxID=2736757 RepID=UPI001CD3D2AF|nr:sigma-70 family RNA polymerase sigma factor [Nocardioides campestrisoli]
MLERTRQSPDHVVPGLELLRLAVLRTLLTPADGMLCTDGMLRTEAVGLGPQVPAARAGGGRPLPPGQRDDRGLATSTEATEPERDRLIALVELARAGDKEAFGLLFDHYHRSVHRFLHHRTGSVQLAEDLTSETFFRALRSMQEFRWQGRDFGAWLMTIARNLAHDHFRSARARLETVTEDAGEVADGEPEPGPEDAVLDRLTSEVLLRSLRELPEDQRDCLVLRFLQGMSLAETAEVLERSTGAVKQLQLRALRALASRLPAGLLAADDGGEAER